MQDMNQLYDLEEAMRDISSAMNRLNGYTDYREWFDVLARMADVLNGMDSRLAAMFDEEPELIEIPKFMRYGCMDDICERASDVESAKISVEDSVDNLKNHELFRDAAEVLDDVFFELKMESVALEEEVAREAAREFEAHTREYYRMV